MKLKKNRPLVPGRHSKLYSIACYSTGWLYNNFLIRQLFNENDDKLGFSSLIVTVGLSLLRFWALKKSVLLSTVVYRPRQILVDLLIFV